MQTRPSRPSAYRTSAQVRTGIAHAYSGVFNPRGLEKIWYGPYGYMFCDLTSSYNGHITAHCQYPMWIPSFLALELKLRQDFKDNNVDYNLVQDKDNTGESDDESIPDQEENNGDDSGEKGSSIGQPSNTGRKSQRLIALKETQRLADVRKRRELVKNLLNRRKDLFVKTESFDDSGDEGPNVSRESAVSQPEMNAIDEEPDFVLSHIAHYYQPPVGPNSSEAEKRHYLHRAGVKVFHQCCPLIAELKSAAPRFYKGLMQDFFIKTSLWLACSDLMEYCSAYFKCNAEAKSVIALAASGPFWYWANIQKADVPEFDWRTKKHERKNDPKVKIFRRKFGLKYHTLGTSKSDKELTKINQEYIWPLLNNGHFEVITPQT
ncbi:hypothetical protein BDZ94DRAFT_1316007 [Collybia nuda]|uniref:Uncharacterized protein n=1 Tax=Collybia nuda TaxID=64659 RepID=A0A9P5XSA2_9AGAR|nr:hypothetical protein BDZ94DRAFT_1316007 [Collybia nuda]